MPPYILLQPTTAQLIVETCSAIMLSRMPWLYVRRVAVMHSKFHRFRWFSLLLESRLSEAAVSEKKGSTKRSERSQIVNFTHFQSELFRVFRALSCQYPPNSVAKQNKCGGSGDSSWVFRGHDYIHWSIWGVRNLPQLRSVDDLN